MSSVQATRVRVWYGAEAEGNDEENESISTPRRVLSSLPASESIRREQRDPQLNCIVITVIVQNYSLPASEPVNLGSN